MPFAWFSDVRRMAPPPPRSLLDNPFFLAELEAVDLPPAEDQIWDGVRRKREPDVTEASDDEDDFDYASDGEVTWLEDPARRAVVTIGVFVVMMLAGGAAAAVVFHDRVAQILRIFF
jgi:hypothetical protein